MKADVAILPESSNKTLQSGIAGPFTEVSSTHFRTNSKTYGFEKHNAKAN